MNMITRTFFHILLFGLACWTFITFFHTSEQIAKSLKTNDSELHFVFNLIPILLFGLVLSIYTYLEKKAVHASGALCSSPTNLKSRMKESR